MLVYYGAYMDIMLVYGCWGKVVPQKSDVNVGL